MSYNDWTISYKRALSMFPKLSASTARYLLYATGALAFLGFLDATYLTVLHYKNIIPPCTLHGCEAVLSSSYATVLGVPVSLIGAFYYVTVLVLVGIVVSNSSDKSHTSSFMGLTSKNIPTILVLLTGLGLLIGILLVLLQAFVLHAFCQYCLASEVIDFLLFDCAWWLWRKNG